MLDAFHIVKLGTAAVDEVRGRTQQEAQARRGRTGDPLYGIRHIFRWRERLAPRQQARLEIVSAADSMHVAV